MTVALRILTVAALLGVGTLILTGNRLALFEDGAAMRTALADLGPAGPAVIVAVLAAAIVFSPLPSAPIALAAGAAYGHFWGTAYVVAGAELGALAAFGIARVLGYEALRRWFGDRIGSAGLVGSQGALTFIVFASRLIPFISFDVVSYAAGLTPLAAWRFAAATLLGIIPASFALAHFGGEFMVTEPHHVALAALALGVVTGAPIVYRLVLRKP